MHVNVKSGKETERGIFSECLKYVYSFIEIYLWFYLFI